MKSIIPFFFLIICFNFIDLKLEEEVQIYSNISITNIISKEVSIGGYLLLQTEGILILGHNKDKFPLLITKDDDKSQYSLQCFFYQFEDYIIGKDTIVCKIQSDTSIQTGKYYLSQSENEMIIDETNIKILPYNIIDSFNIIDIQELNIYSLRKLTLSFSSNTDSDSLKFNIFEEVPYHETSVYFDDLEFKCVVTGKRVKCPISASVFPQDKRFQSYNVYYKDSKGNKKKSILARPIEVTLEYIQKKNLKIKVTKLLTNCLIKHDYIVFDTTDETLENLLFSSSGFYLDVKKENFDSENNKLLCNFHKIPKDTTKIFCEASGRFEDGTYTIDQYISEGPIEDDRDSISSNYQIIIPTFFVNSQFVYSSKEEDNTEKVFDNQLREKIYLKYENGEEYQYIILNFNRDVISNKYFLGNSEIESEVLFSNFIKFKIPRSNFEKSGIYYFEKINAINEKERLYLLPPIEVTISSN